MAIAKIKSKKVEYSRQSAIQVGIAGGLVLVSLLFIWLSISRWSFKSNFVRGLEASDRNRAGDIGPALDAAVARKPSHVGARLVLAKRLVDENSLDRAEELYRQLLEMEPPNPAIIHAGLGVIALRRADAASDVAAATPFLKAAREKYKAAGSLPEAEIGMKHADLIEAVKGKNGAKIEALRTDFGKLLAKFKPRGGDLTKEGFIDLYAGLGVTQAWGGRYSKEAADYFNACYQYAPRWPLPMINRIYIEAQKYAQTPMDLGFLKREHPQIEATRNNWENLSSGGNPAYKNLPEAWFQYTLAVAYRFAEQDAVQGEFANWMNSLKNSSTWRQRPEVWRLECMEYFRAGLRSADPNVREGLINQGGLAVDTFLAQGEAMKEDRAFVEVRAVALANSALIHEMEGARMQDPSRYQEAVRRWQQALQLEQEKLGMADGSYETNRNLAVVLRRLERAADAQARYDAAVKVGEASESESVKADLVKLKKFWAGEAVQD